MGTDIAVIPIHGMGDQWINYWHPLKDGVARRLGDEMKHVHFFSIYYQDVLKANQNDMIDRMKHYVGWKLVREFLLWAVSDATSIESNKHVKNSTYDQVQREIVDVLDNVYDTLGPKVPVVIVAQSLGGQVISNYLWDSRWVPCGQKPPKVGIWKDPCNLGEPLGTPKDQFRRLHSLNTLITTGCNIPIFVAGHDEIVAIKPPNADFSWKNYYDRDDVLGWPLSPLSNSYNTLVDDYEIGTGGIFRAHTNYWTDQDFLDPLAKLLLDMVTD